MGLSDDTEGAVAAVHAWWKAWNDKDRETVERLAVDDFLEFPGEGDHRVEGRQGILGTADGSFARVTIDNWSLSEVVAWRDGSLAGCSYRWEEHGKKDDIPWGQEGYALDLLVLVDGEWRLQAHHVSKIKKTF